MSRQGWIIVAVAAFVLLARRTVFAVKPGATLSTKPEIEHARRIVASVYQANGYTVTVTEGWASEGHTANSKHYEGLAEDYRVNDIPFDKWLTLAAQIRARLGSDYDVLLERDPDHIHVEYDPK
jgi:hypothetical protein